MKASMSSDNVQTQKTNNATLIICRSIHTYLEVLVLGDISSLHSDNILTICCKLNARHDSDCLNSRPMPRTESANINPKSARVSLVHACSLYACMLLYKTVQCPF